MEDVDYVVGRDKEVDLCLSLSFVLYDAAEVGGQMEHVVIAQRRVTDIDGATHSIAFNRFDCPIRTTTFAHTVTQQVIKRDT